MSSDINIVTLVGRATADPEVRQAGSSQLASFGIAVNRKYGDKEEVGFFDITVWGEQRASIIQQYLKKGDRIGIVGRLKQDSWEQDGQRRTKVGIVADNFQFLGGKSSNSEGDSDGEPSDAELANAARS